MVKNFDYLKELHRRIYQKEDFPVHVHINLTGGRQSAKTWSAEEFCAACLVLKNVDIRVECFRYMKGDRDEMLIGIEEALERTNANYLGVNRVTKYLFENKNNKNLLRISGIKTINNRTTKALGRGQKKCDYLIFWIDEVFEWEEKDYLDLMSALRNYKNLIVIRSSNPWFNHHWWVKQVNKDLPEQIEELETEGFQIKKEPEDKFLKVTHRTNWRVNKQNLPISTHEYFKGLWNIDPARAKVEDLGLSGAVSGVIYANYLSKVRRYVPDSIVDFFGGLDFGFDKDALHTNFMGATSQYAMVGIIDEWRYEKATNGFRDHNTLAFNVVSFYRQQLSKYPLLNRGVTVFCDNSEKSFIQMLNNEAMKQDLPWLLFRPCQKLRIYTRVHKTIGIMSEGRFFINEKCVYSWYEYQTAVWDDRTTTSQEPKPKDINNHATDATDYALTSRYHLLNPIVRQPNSPF